MTTLSTRDERRSARLPSPTIGLSVNQMHCALEARDPAYDRAFYVGVRSTGVFCRCVCPSRTPRPDRREFFVSVSAAMQAGYRACLRCKPTTPAPGAPAWAGRIIARMNESPERVLTAADVRACGADAAQASRYFKSRFGNTPQALSRARRVGLALRWIRLGGSVDKARRAAGFASESGFRAAVTDLFGTSPTDAARHTTDPIVAAWVETPMGPMLAGATDAGVCLLEFVDRRGLATQLDTLRRRLKRPIVPGSSEHLHRLGRELQDYFAGAARSEFRVPIDVPGTAFQRQVWDELRRVPMGTTRTYAELARRVGRAGAVRAVARAVGDNRLAIIVPCHRIIGTSGDLTGYAGGLWRKQRLLELEGAPMRHARIEPDAQANLWGSRA